MNKIDALKNLYKVIEENWDLIEKNLILKEENNSGRYRCSLCFGISNKISDGKKEIDIIDDIIHNKHCPIMLISKALADIEEFKEI